MLETFVMSKGGKEYGRLVRAFERIFGATIFFGSDSSERNRKSRAQSGRRGTKSKPSNLPTSFLARRRSLKTPSKWPSNRANCPKTNSSRIFFHQIYSASCDSGISNLFFTRYFDPRFNGSQVNNATPQCNGHSLGAIRNVQFREDIPYVHLHRVFSNGKVRGDLFVALSHCHQR